LIDDSNGTDEATRRCFGNAQRILEEWLKWMNSEKLTGQILGRERSKSQKKQDNRVDPKVSVSFVEQDVFQKIEHLPSQSNVVGIKTFVDGAFACQIPQHQDIEVPLREGTIESYLRL
jgi:hypothetical protein